MSLSFLIRSCVLCLYFLRTLVQKIDRMYAAFTGQPLEKVQEYTERDRFLSTSEVCGVNPECLSKTESSCFSDSIRVVLSSQ